MIDSGDGVIQTELQIGQQQIVFGNGWKRFKVAHEVIAEIADGSAPKIGQARKRLDLRAGE
jgi:hypothetical protein